MCISEQTELDTFREEYGSRPDYGMRERSSSLRPASRTEELDEYGRRSHVSTVVDRSKGQDMM